MAVLAFVKSENVFLKIMKGDGSNLLDEDEEEGYVDYALYSTFRPSDLGIDAELEMELVDEGGQVMLKKPKPALKVLPTAYEMAFDKKYKKNDVIILMDDKEEGYGLLYA